MSVPPPRSVLVICASGRTGQAVLQALHACPRHEARAHAFLHTPSKLPPALAEPCDSVFQCDGHDYAAVQRALVASGGTDVVLFAGVPGGLSATDVRSATGRALAAGVQGVRDAGRYSGQGGGDGGGDGGVMPRVVVVSALGAGGSTICIGWGVGTVVAAIIGLQLRDHDEQERFLKDSFRTCPERLLIARPTGLANEPASGGVRQGRISD